MVNRFLKPLFYWQQGNGIENAWIEKQTFWTETKKRKRKSVKLFFRNELSIPRHDKHYKLLSFYILRSIFTLLFPVLQTFCKAFVL